MHDILSWPVRTIFTVAVLVVLLIFALILRHFVVYFIRAQLREYGYDYFNALPGYGAMVWNPRYWHLWTRRQWTRARKIVLPSF